MTMKQLPRRIFLKQIAASSGALAVAAPGIASAADATPAAPAQPGLVGYQSFGPDEAAFVETLVNIMCPADSLTPNGVDCGLATYGYQLPLTPEQFFKTGVAAAKAACTTKLGKGFDELSEAEANAFLTDVAGGKYDDPRVPLAEWFNELVYPLFTQACFADPLYGGNRGKAFWKLIGYPGLPAFHTKNIVEFRGKPFPGAADPKSIQDFS